MNSRVSCDLAASTGIHTGEGVVKMLLAGASVAQVASTLYLNGPNQVSRILKRMQRWMEEKGFTSVQEFQGIVSGQYEDNPATFERMQFMKHYSEIS